GRLADRSQRYRLQVLATPVRRVLHLRGDHRTPPVAPGRSLRSARMKRPAGYGADPTIRWTEWLPWIAAVAVFFLLPEYLLFGARILTYILFALSLDLILGYAGIVTLGHSPFFGLGAYTAGGLAAEGWGHQPPRVLAGPAGA